MEEINRHKNDINNVIDSMLFGQNIRTLRMDMKLTREEFSELSGVSVDYLGKIERGQDIPSLVICIKIANALNTTIDFLLNATKRIATSSTYEVKLNKLILKMDDTDKKFLVKFLELHKSYILSASQQNTLQ